MARILIAEDDPSYAQVLERLLEAAGYAADSVPEGEAAIVRVREDPPDLLLLDVYLPGMDGYAVARALKADPATAVVPIIFITGACEPQSCVRGLESGGHDYITKPFHRAELLARVAAALRTRQREDSLRREAFEMAEMARTDPLTGLPNRRAFDERLKQEVARQRRYGHPLSALMLDIDHFKQVNDTILHSGGDQVLRTVARCLLGLVRANDLVARIGGEEFAVICPETESAGAQALAERIRGAIETLHDRGETPLPITISIGVATLPRGAPPLVGEPMRTADAALNEAKDGGRNRVVVAPAIGT